MKSNRFGNHSKSVSLCTCIMAFSLSFACCHAYITTTGQITNEDGTIQWDWINNTPGSTSKILVGYDSFGTMTMSGNSTALNFFQLFIADGDNTTGTFTMRDGASVIFASSANTYIYIANGIDSEATMTVKGTDTIMDLSDNLYVGKADGSSGELVIQDGAVFKSGYLQYFGYSAGSYGKATVDGIGSQMRTGDGTNIGWSGAGEIVIKNGGYVYTKNHCYFGYVDGASGIAEVSGAGSLWQAGGTFQIGRGSSSSVPNPATGILKMARGGKIESASVIVGYRSYHALGTLDFIIGNTGAGAVNCGLIETSNIRLNNADLQMHVDPGVNLTIGVQYILADYGTLGQGDWYKQFIGIAEGDIYTSPEGYNFRINYATDLGGGDLGITATVTELPPCVVDDIDLYLVTSRWLDAGCGVPDWCGGADLDQNEYVDLGDLSKIAQNWLDACPAGWPWQ